MCGVCLSLFFISRWKDNVCLLAFSSHSVVQSKHFVVSWVWHHHDRHSHLYLFPLSFLHLLETSQRFGEHTDEMYSTLHPLHQTQRDQEAQRLGGEPVSDRLLSSSQSHMTPNTQTCKMTHFLQQSGQIICHMCILSRNRQFQTINPTFSMFLNPNFNQQSANESIVSSRLIIYYTISLWFKYKISLLALWGKHWIIVLIGFASFLCFLPFFGCEDPSHVRRVSEAPRPPPPLSLCFSFPHSSLHTGFGYYMFICRVLQYCSEPMTFLLWVWHRVAH